MKNFPIVKSRRLRSTPYTDRIESHGVSSYTVYNHMLLPASFKSLESDYHHLKKFVQVWDVAAERQVEISGKDSAKLVQLMTCRDLSKSKVGRCYYAPLVDDQGLLVNDPIINKLADDRWWLSIADSDVIFFAKGLAAGNKFEVEIKEPNVNILAVQGPLSDDLMAKLFGDEIRQLKFFNFKYYNFKKYKYFIARSGWSKQSGFEIYVEDNLAGQDLYDYLTTGSTKNELLNHIVKDRLGKKIPVSEFKRSLEPLLDAKFYNKVVMMDGDEWCNYKFGPGSVHLSPQDKPTAMCVQKIEKDLGVSAWEVLVDDKVREKLNNMLQERN